jgi:hypothetical protein
VLVGPTRASFAVPNGMSQFPYEAVYVALLVGQALVLFTWVAL